MGLQRQRKSLGSRRAIPPRGGATRLVLVRHGQTEWNTAGRIQGASDISLDDVGREQARRAGRRLASLGCAARGPSALPIGAVYSSDLARARETARIIWEHFPEDRRRAVALRTSPALRELSYGQWEGKTRAELEAEGQGEALARWQRGDGDALPPGAETKAEAEARVERFLACVPLGHPDETVVVVGHGGSLRLMLCLLLGIPTDEWGRIRLANAGLSEAILVPGRRPRVTVVNFTGHLRGMVEERLTGPLQSQ